MTDVERIAKGLTKAQREAILLAEVFKPLSFMPTYNMIRMAARQMSAAETEDLKTLGLVTLPICEGARSGYPIYEGEIHPLGLSVRAHLMKEVK